MYRFFSRLCGFSAPILLAASLWTSAQAAPAPTAPTPAPAPGGPANIFYGGINPAASVVSPVILFVHGLGSNAEYWFTNGNNMYQDVYNSGYRSAYISMNADNSGNTAPIAQNAQTLQGLMPIILQHFNVQQVYIVSHSKGGMDTEVAMLDATFRSEVKAIFTIATPNQGTELADWAFGPGAKIANLFGLQTPGLYDLRPEHVATLRAQLDPIFATAGIQFYTIEGGKFSGQTGGLVYDVTGPILKNLTNGVDNDGLVAVPEVWLPDSYAEDMGEIKVDHTDIAYGSNAWPYIYGRFSGLENRMPGWQQIANGGFGNDNNAWAWSQIWFNGYLFVGTGTNVDCVTADTAAVQTGVDLYPSPSGARFCPEDPLHIAQPAQIWRYTPQTKTWAMVYQSPQDIPLGTDQDGNPAFAARSIGFRNFGIYTESDGVTQALYVGGVSAISIYNNLPMYNNNNYPAPIILRSTDGQNFTELPHDPGTFLGDIVQNNTDIFVSSYRSIVQANGQMFVAVANFRGEGFIMASPNPSEGNNSFQRVSMTPALPNFAVWVLAAYNNALYVGTGDRKNDLGYAVFKTTDVAGDPVPYNYTQIVENGGGQQNESTRSPTALTMHVYTQPDDNQEHLWVGTDRKIEILRVNPDDSWDLIMGQPRQTAAAGFKTPLSGIAYYFDNDFDGHVWQMQSSPETGIYASTWDWSVLLRQANIANSAVTGEQGFDFYNSPDSGNHWYIVSRTGMGDGYNFGGRSGNFNHFGLFWGTARTAGGLQVWQNNSVLDLNGDGKISLADAAIVQSAIGQTAIAPFDARDVNGNGTIDAQDVQFLESQCTFPNCSEVPGPGMTYVPPPAPFVGYLTAGDQLTVGETTVLTWPAQANAKTYHVYRYTNTPVAQLLLNGFPNQTINISQNMTVNFPDDFTNGTLNAACPAGETLLWYCQMANLMQSAATEPQVGTTPPTPPFQMTWIGFPSALVEVAQTTATTYSEPLPTTLQSIYYVRSEDVNGNLGGLSNIVGAPSFLNVDPTQFCATCP